jgi:hypothetical protein
MFVHEAVNTMVNAVSYMALFLSFVIGFSVSVIVTAAFVAFTVYALIRIAYAFQWLWVGIFGGKPWARR